MSRKIAIVVISNVYIGCDDFEPIVRSITNWEEISEEDYKILKKAQLRSGNRFIVIEQPTDQTKFIKDTVSAYLEEERLALKRLEEQRAARADAKKKREEKTRKKKEEEEKALLLQLQQKYSTKEFPDVAVA